MEMRMGDSILRSQGKLPLSDQSYLAAYLLENRNMRETKFFEYISMLPTDLESFSSFPIFFSVDEKNLLEGSSFCYKAKTLIDSLEEEYDEICH